MADTARLDGHAVQQASQISSAVELRERIHDLDQELGFLAAPLPPRPVLRSANIRCDHDDELAKTLRDCGFGIVGGSAEFGVAVTAEPVAYGPVRNPWHTGHTAGGSSGGSACAVATGAVVDTVAGTLSDAGHDVRESRPTAFDDYDEFSMCSVSLVASGLAEMGRTLSWIDARIDSLLGWWDSFDVLVSPTVPTQAPELGWYGDPETSLAAQIQPGPARTAPQRPTNT